MKTFLYPVRALAAILFLFLAGTAHGAEPLFTGQADILRGLNASYRLHFSEARGIFAKMVTDYPSSPAGTFYSAAIDSGMTESDLRWRLVANLYAASPFPKREVRKPAEQEKGLKNAIARCETLLRKNPDDFEALFYMAGSYAFLARMEAYRSNYLSAMYYGKKSTGYFDRLHQRYPGRGDAMIGPAVYKFHVGRLPQPMQWLVWFLGLSGTKEEGIRLAGQAYEKAALSRIEAADFLARVNWQYDGNYPQAIVWADVLEREIPDAPLADFARLFAFHYMQDTDKEEKALRGLMARMEGIDPEARADWEPLFLFALGTINEKKGNAADARALYGKAVAAPHADPRLIAEISPRLKTLAPQTRKGGR